MSAQEQPLSGGTEGATGLRKAAGAVGRFARRDAVAAVSLVTIGVLVFLMFFGRALAPQDPDRVNLSAAFQGPSAQHWLGTDASGRDLLSRLLAGARPTLGGALLVTVLATTAGVAIALAAAWSGGWADASVSRFLDTLFAFPGLLLAFLAVAMFGRGFVAPVAALAVANVPWVARVVRSVAKRERDLPYIVALEAQGFSRLSITRRHLMPNISRTIGAQAALTFTYAMVDLAAINFLGLGIQPPTSDWGVMTAEGQSSILRGSPQESLFASLFIVVAVLSVTLVSYRLGAERGGPLR